MRKCDKKRETQIEKNNNNSKSPQTTTTRWWRWWWGKRRETNKCVNTFRQKKEEKEATLYKKSVWRHDNVSVLHTHFISHIAHEPTRSFFLVKSLLVFFFITSSDFFTFSCLIAHGVYVCWFGSSSLLLFSILAVTSN